MSVAWGALTLLLAASTVLAEPVHLVRRGITADNPTGVYIAYNLGWHNPATGNFGGNITLGELAPTMPRKQYSIKLFFNSATTLVQDYWGDYRITHYQSGAYHIQPGVGSIGPNATRIYQFNGVYSIGGNSTVQNAFISAASLLHGPNYNDRETGFQRDDVRITQPAANLPTAPFGPFVRTSGARNSPSNNGTVPAGAESAAAADAAPLGGKLPLIAGIAGGVVALVALAVIVFLVMRKRKASPKKSAPGTASGKLGKPPAGGWTSMEAASSTGGTTMISPPTPVSAAPIGQISGPTLVGATGAAATQVMRSAGYSPQQQQHHQPQQHYQQQQHTSDVSNFVMGDQGAGSHATPEQQQLDFVEQYASANYQPNPYRDTMATTTVGVNHYGYRDTLAAAPPVPNVPNHHYPPQQQQADDVDIADMVERYGHDSMYPQQTSEPYNYESYPAVPDVPKGYHARDTFFTPAHGVSTYGAPPPMPGASPAGGSYNASSALKQRLEAEEAKLAAQQRHLAEMENTTNDYSYANSSGMPQYQQQDRYVDDAQRDGKTAGVVRSRSTVSRAPKSPMRTEAPPEWLGGTSVGQGSELSRSVPGPGYI